VTDDADSELDIYELACVR